MLYPPPAPLSLVSGFPSHRLKLVSPLPTCVSDREEEESQEVKGKFPLLPFPSYPGKHFLYKNFFLYIIGQKFVTRFPYCIIIIIIILNLSFDGVEDREGSQGYSLL